MDLIVNKFVAILLLVFALVPASAGSSDVLPSVSQEASTIEWRAPSLGKTIQLHKVEDLKRGSFWVVKNVTVGDKRGLTLLVDTGSTDLLLFEDVYKPSKKSKRFLRFPKFNAELYQTTKYGTGHFIARGNVYRDIVSFDGLTIDNQVLGACNYNKFVPKSSRPQADGIWGFSRAANSQFYLPGTQSHAPSWFEHLCQDKLLPECRLGIAFGTNGIGSQVLGALDKSLLRGELTYAPFHSTGSYITSGDFAVKNKILLRNRTVLFDTGGPNLSAPIPDAMAIFKALGLQTVRLKNPDRLFGYYPCDKPPTAGFSLPAKSDIANPPPGETTSKSSRVFNVAPSAWELANNGNNNCTATLVGIKGIGLWVYGQGGMQGKYLDFNIDKQAIGFGDLKHPKTGM